MRRFALILLMIASGTGATTPAPDARPASAIDELDDSSTRLRLCFEDADVPPWRWRDRTGHNFRLLDAVAESVGVRFHYVALPWRRCQSDLARGRVDGAFALSYTPERRAIGLYSPTVGPDPSLRLFVDGYALVVRKDSDVSFRDGRITGLQQPIGTQPAYSISVDLRRQGYAVDDGSPDATALLQRPSAGRIDAAAMGLSVIREMQARRDPVLDGLHVLPEPLVRKDYFLMLSQQFFERDPGTARAIWDAVAALRDGVPVAEPR